MTSKSTFTIRTMLLAMVGFAIAAAFLRYSLWHPQGRVGFAGASFWFCATLCSVFAHFWTGKEDSAWNGFLIGGTLGILLGGFLLAAGD